MELLTDCIHHYIERQAARTPHATALKHGSDYLTYEGLNERANRLAYILQAQGVGIETVVGICLPSSIQAVIGVLGVLKAGGAYMALDPNDPDGRLSAMLDATAARVVLTNTQYTRRFPTNVIVVDVGNDCDASRDATDPHVEVGPDHLAFIRYTSGSTGKPKAVPNTHRSITNRLTAQPLPDIRQTDVCAVNTSLGFGSRLFYPLALGASVVVLTNQDVRDANRFVRQLRHFGITSIYMVPSLLRPVLHSTEILRGIDSLQVVTLGGEAVTPDLLSRFAQLLPHVQLISIYGSNEIGTAATLRLVNPDGREPWRALGQTVPNTRVYVLDEALQELPVGMTGEICVASPHLARGYLNEPAITAQRFVPDPFDDTGGARLYRTGDLGWKLPDGQIAFVGRNDQQVKIRGFRVELGEIEATLYDHPHVAEAAVNDLLTDGERRLIAYIVPEIGMSPTADLLREYLRTRLPHYMQPTTCIFVDALPRTPTGKINRRALQPPAPTRPELAHSYSPPRNDLEGAITDIWSEVLTINPIGIHDPFLDLGGDSLMAIRIMSRISERLDMDLSIETLFDHPTIAELTATIQQAQDRPASSAER